MDNIISGIDNTESTELQLNHINCESTDSESDTENTILVNMIEVENDYETVTYEKPFHSYVYENQLEILLNYYIRPRSNNIPIEKEAKEATTLHEPEKEHVTCSSTNRFLPKYTKRTTKRNDLDYTISLES